MSLTALSVPAAVSTEGGFPPAPAQAHPPRTLDRQALRWYTLFLGVMKCVPTLPSHAHLLATDTRDRDSVLYVVWDIADDKYFMKANDSDASQWAMLYPRMGVHNTYAFPSLPPLSYHPPPHYRFARYPWPITHHRYSLRARWAWDQSVWVARGRVSAPRPSRG